MNKKISIIIVTYNSESVIQECLESIQKYNEIGNKLEIILVDNSPVFNIEKFIDNLNLILDIKIIHNPANGGFGQGNNIGAREANGDLLFMLNPDTILIEPIFKFMIKEFKDENLTSAGFRLIGRDGTINNSFGLLPEYNYLYIFLHIKLLYFFVIRLGLFSKLIFPWGADLIVRKKDFQKAGMFDENIFLCNEEPDLMRRLDIKNVRIFKKRIVHLEGHTTEVYEVRFNEWLKSTKYYFYKYNLSYGKFLKNELFLKRIKFYLKKVLFLKNKHLKQYIKLIGKELNEQ